MTTIRRRLNNFCRKPDGLREKADIMKKEGGNLPLVISAMADDSVRVDMAKMCAAQLQAVGVNATAEAKASLTGADRTAASSAGAVLLTPMIIPTKCSLPVPAIIIRLTKTLQWTDFLKKQDIQKTMMRERFFMENFRRN